MAHSVPKFQRLKEPAGPSPLTPEQRYWRGFKSSLNLPSQSPITHISFPPPPNNTLISSNHHCFVATSGTRLQIYSVRTRKLIKTITRFSDIAHCGEVRRDGRIMVAGDDSGKIHVFDVQSRAILKTWDEHKQPVWTTKFSPTDLTTLMSACDDRTVRLWDLPSGQSTMTFLGHTDYVRCGNFMPGTMSNLFLTGSYDETVRLWDPRMPGRSAMTFKHAAPVEAVLPMLSRTQVLAAAENQISVLDIVAGRPLQILKNHQKTVTSLCLASHGTRLVSGGLDGHVKVFETAGWNVVHGSKYSSPVLAVSVISSGTNRDDKHLVAGLQSGILSIKTRLSGQEKVKQREREKEMLALIDGTLDEHDQKIKKRTRAAKSHGSMNFMGEGVAVIIEGQDRTKRKPETAWERDLRLGKYARALDRVLEQKLASTMVLAVFINLRHRSALRAALEGRDESSVQPIFNWVTKHLTDPRYVSVCTDVSLLLLDIYSEYIGDSLDLEKSIRALHHRARLEVARAQQACQVSGMLKMLMTRMP